MPRAAPAPDITGCCFGNYVMAAIRARGKSHVRPEISPWWSAHCNWYIVILFQVLHLFGGDFNTEFKCISDLHFSFFILMGGFCLDLLRWFIGQQLVCIYFTWIFVQEDVVFHFYFPLAAKRKVWTATSALAIYGLWSCIFRATTSLLQPGYPRDTTFYGFVDKHDLRSLWYDF